MDGKRGPLSTRIGRAALTPGRVHEDVAKLRAERDAAMRAAVTDGAER